MGNTPRGYPYAESSDTPDGAAQGQALAEAVDADVTQVIADRDALLPQMWIKRRTMDDAVGSGQWGQSVNWSATVPAGVVTFSAVYNVASSSKSYFRVTGNGVEVVEAMQDYTATEALTTISGAFTHPGGVCTLIAEFGFATNTVTIKRGSHLTVSVSPNAVLIEEST